MSIKFIVAGFLSCLALPTLAQQQMLAEAFEDFASSRFMEYEEVPVIWTMEGKLQADLNDGINNLAEDMPALAEASFTAVLKKDSTLWQAYYFRAAARKQINRFAGAQRDLEHALRLHKDFYEGYVELAKVFHLRRQDVESERAIKKAIQIDKSRATAYYLRGDINLSQNQVKAAGNNYRECLEVDSLFHDARIKLAMLDLLAKKNEDVALQRLTQVLGYDSLQKSALMFRGILLYDKDKEQSVRDLSNLILVSPNNLMALYFRGMLYAELGKYSLAFLDFQKVIKATATSENNFEGQQSWTDKKIDLQNVGAYTLTRVYGLPETDAAKLKQAYCNILTGSYDKSITVINETSTPNEEPLCVYLKAVAYEHKGEHVTAFKFYSKALELDNELVDAYKKCGIYEQELKQWDKSIDDLSAVLRLTPDAFIIYKIRGVSYYHKNEFDLAIADFNAYLKYDSVSKEVLGFRGMAYLESNQRLKAYDDFALSKNPQGFRFKDMDHLLDSVLLKGDTTLALYYVTNFTLAAAYFTEGFVTKFKIHLARNEWKPIEMDIAWALENSRVDADESDHACLLTFKAMIQVRKKNEGEALKTFDEAIKYDKKNSLAYLERGKVLLRMGKVSKAESDFKLASSLGNEQAKRLLASGLGGGK